MADTSLNLKGRVALITGSARNLGRAAALSLAEAGADIVVNYINDKKAADSVEQKIKSFGVRVLSVQADVRNWEKVIYLIKTTEEKMGRIDILINNVGDFLEKPMAMVSVEEWHNLIASNLHSVFYCCKAVLPIMKAQRYGRIINIGLANADRIQAYKEITPYAIAKTGVSILSKSFAAELAKHGITVNMVSPGLMNTETSDSSTVREQTHKIPMARIGTPDDYTTAIKFFLAKEASYITGTNIIVSGGWGL